MGLLNWFSLLSVKKRRSPRGRKPDDLLPRRCRFETMEPRRMLAADPLLVGSVYIEDDSGSDLEGDTFELSFEGGAPGTQLTRVVIDGDQGQPGFDRGDVFFDTADSGLGADHASPFQIVSSAGIGQVTETVVDGGTRLVLDFQGFEAGEKLIFTIDVDEVEDYDPDETDVTIINQGFDPITSGIEFQSSLFEASFAAPHYHDVQDSGTYRNIYTFDPALDLSPDNVDGKRDRTAGAQLELQQTPLPVTIAGTVFHDRNLNLVQDSGDEGIVGVELGLLVKDDSGQYVDTGFTAATDGTGDYEFGPSLNLLPGTYRVVETQPGGFEISVGAIPGTVEGADVGETVAGDTNVLTEIAIPLGGQAAVDYDFAEANPVEIHGNVHLSDPSGDCFTEGVNHPPLEGVTVRLFDAQGTLIDETLTDANGDYWFTDLLPGEYTVVEITPDHLIQGGVQVGLIDGTQTGAVTAVDTVSGIVLTSGQIGVDYDFCEHEPAEISGFVYKDLNDDGVKQSNEPGIEDVEVVLLDDAGNVAGTQRTDATGLYAFTRLRAGTYTIRETHPEECLDGTDAAGTVNGVTVGTAVNPGDEIRDVTLLWGDRGFDYNFGELEPASISGFVYEDLDNDGRRESGEPGIGGAEVILLDAAGNEVTRRPTGANGFYEFTRLRPGVYSVVETQPSPYIDGLDAAGTIAGVVVGAAVNPGDRIDQITLRPGDDGVEYNFGEILPAEIHGNVHLSDRFGDCFTEGVTHPPLAGVTVLLLNDQGDTIAETQTDTNGDYSFGGLLPGTYRVVEITPDGLFNGGAQVGEVDGNATGTLGNSDTILGISLLSGDVGLGYDFCEFAPAEISGFVYKDLNDDGVKQSGEPGIAGVEVVLLDDAGNEVASQLTGATGLYAFTNLRAGTYTIRETHPVDCLDGTDAAGTINGVVVGTAVNPGDEIRNVELLWGDRGFDYNFGELEPASISGFVYEDRDNDGRRETAEPGIAGAEVILLDDAGNEVGRRLTDADGRYEFTDLRPGVYRVIETQPAPYIDGIDAAGTIGGTIVGAAVNPGDAIEQITLRPGDHGIEYNFGEILPAEIHGNVHLSDPFGDCFTEGVSYPPLEGVTVLLLNEQGDTIAQTQTDADGDYWFTDLLPGTYGVFELTPSNLIDGMAHVGEVDGVTTGVLNGSDTIRDISLLSGDAALNYSFCEHEPTEISGFVYKDANDDGVRQSGEAGIAGVEVTLLDEAGNEVASQLTDANGMYAFTGLPAGTYTIRETHPDECLDGTDAAGTVNGVTVGTAVNPGDEIRDVALLWGDRGVDYNFGELEPASISGFVYEDRDNDGLRENGEAGIAIVEVALFDDAGNEIDRQFTDDTGHYEFTGLRPGIYSVREVQPLPYIDGIDAAGTIDGAVVGSAQNPGDSIVQIQLLPGDRGVEYNFGEILPAEIHGNVHLSDPFGNCVDEGVNFRPLEGVTVLLLNEQGDTVAETLTDANGDYWFTDLLPGVYRVVELTPDGLLNGDGHPGEVNGVPTGQFDGNDTISGIALLSGDVAFRFDFCEHEPADVSGFVYEDVNNNGLRETGEPAIAGATVILLDDAGNQVATRQTDTNGHYLFDGLSAGTYTIVEVQPDGYLDGLDAAGTISGTVVGQAVNPGDRIESVDLLFGDHGIEYNFGELLPATLGGIVHAETDGDCILEPGEVVLEGVVLHLVDADGAIVDTTTTDADGRYRFENVLPGVYAIVEEQPADYFHGGQTVGDNGGDASVDDMVSGINISSGQLVLGYHFCEIPPSSISGFVFQDGAEIVTPDGQPPANLFDIRDGQQTPDDTPIRGVVLELRNGITGEPILADQALPGVYAAGPITTTTDAAGFYEFLGLPTGNYAVFEVHPATFVDSLDTPGTTSGIAINANGLVPEFVLLTLTVDPLDDAIVRIPLAAGTTSQNNNFSEVLLRSEPPPEEPPEEPPLPPPPPLPPVQQVAPAITPAPAAVPALPAAPAPVPTPPASVFLAGGGLIDYSWHLSIINAGQPRGDDNAEDEESIWLAAALVDAQRWQASMAQQGEWIIVDQSSEDEDDDDVRRFYFGLHGAIPVVGDFNGDGIDEFGLFYQGHWFLDMNRNGQWDENDLWAKLGGQHDQPVTGDWDDDGKDDIGIYGPIWPGDPRAIEKEPGLPDANNTRQDRPKNMPPKEDEATTGRRMMKHKQGGETRSHLIDHVFRYGEGAEVAVSGDWNGDGIRTAGVFQDGTWRLDVDGDGKPSAADRVIEFGRRGDYPVVGDFDGNSVDDIGVYRAGKWILDTNRNQEIDAHDKVFEMGGAADIPVVGDWNGDGTDEIGLYRDQPSDPE